jgi:zinc transporter 9
MLSPHHPFIKIKIQGGTFLYVATVLQPVSHHSQLSSADMSGKMRTVLISGGMFVPYLIGMLLGRGHGH